MSDSIRSITDDPLPRIVELAAHAVLVHKGERVVALDLRGLSDVTDFFLIATGDSDVQVAALRDGVREALAAAGSLPRHVEGASGSRWILLDYIDLVVHLMLPEAREYYQIERLWNDAPSLEITPAYFRAPDVQARYPELVLTRGVAAETNEEA